MTGYDTSTFSVVGRCPDTGMVGVAVASAVPCVGAMCVYTRAGAGAAASQARVNPYLAFEALDRLAAGATAGDALAQLLAIDPAAERRQVGVVGLAGPGASHTGALCRTPSGHRTGDGVAVQGNTLVGTETLDAMLEAFAASAGEPLPERLLGALAAGDAAGGDLRGRQSAALQVAWTEDYPYVDIRVDDHTEPIAEVGRILGLVRRDLLPFIAMLPVRGDWADRLDEAAMALLRGGPEERG